MSPRSLQLLLIAAGVLSSVSADAAGLSPDLSIRSSGMNNTAVYAGRPPGHGGYSGGYPAPPLPRSSANDPYDTSQNLNPGGGGGGGLKPNPKPNLK